MHEDGAGGHGRDGVDLDDHDLARLLVNEAVHAGESPQAQQVGDLLALLESCLLGVRGHCEAAGGESGREDMPEG